MSTAAFGTLTIGLSASTGFLDASLGFTLDTALGTHGQSSLLLVTGTATLGGALPGQFRAIPTDPGYIANYTTGTAFTILTAGTISGSFSIPAYNTYDPNSPDFSATYAWGSPLPLSMQNDTTSFPALASGLDWAIDKVTNTDNTQSLVLTVIDTRPVLRGFTPLAAVAGPRRDFDIAFDFNPAATLPSGSALFLEVKQRTSTSGTLSLAAPSATAGNWNTLATLDPSALSLGTDGHYHTTVNLDVGSTYSFQIKALTLEGGMAASATMNYATPMPSLTSIGLSFGEDATTVNTGGTLSTNSFDSHGIPHPQWTDNAFYGFNPTYSDGWAMRSAGSIYGDQWVSGTDNIAYGYEQTIGVWLNGNAPVEFLAWWTISGTKYFASYTTPGTPGGHASFSSYASNANYTIELLADRGYGPEFVGYRNGTESSFTSVYPSVPTEGYPNHAAAFYEFAYQTSGSVPANWKPTMVHYIGTDPLPIAPDNFSAFAVANGDASAPLAINLSWTDQSDNESGFAIQRGIRVTSNVTDVTWSTIATVSGTSYSDDFDFESFSGYGVTYRISAVNGTNSSDTLALGSDILWQHIHFPPPAPDQDIDIASDGGTLTLTNGTNSKLIDLDDLQFLTINTGTSNAHITIDQSLHLFDNIIFNMTGTGDITLTVAHSTMTFTSDLGLAAPHLTLEAASNAALTLSSNQSLEQLLINFGTSVELTTDQFAIETITNSGTLSFNATTSLLITAAITGSGAVAQLGSGATTLTGDYTATGSLYVNAGTLQFAETLAERWSAGVMLKFQSLTIASYAILDITNHDLLIGNSSIGTVETLILAGYGITPAGTPSSAGAPAIISSTAINAGNTFLVPIDADALIGDGSAGSAIGETWDEIEITESSSIIIKFAYSGDADLSGTVDYGDYGPILTNFGQTTPGVADIQTSWLMGDLDLSGTVDFADYGPILATWGLGPL